MVCPFCNATLTGNKGDRVFVALHDQPPSTQWQNALNAATRLGNVTIDEGPLFAHEGCRYRTPYYLGITVNDQAPLGLYPTEEQVAAWIGKNLTRTLNDDHWNEIETASEKHWVTARIRKIDSYPRKEAGAFYDRMWFPLRLATNERASNCLAISLHGAPASGKTMFSVMVASQATYTTCGEAANFHNHFAYAVPRLVVDDRAPYANHVEALQAIKKGTYIEKPPSATEPRAEVVCAAFFHNPLSGSNIDTVLVQDLPGEDLKNGYSSPAANFQKRTPKPYQCLIVRAPDLSPLLPCTEEKFQKSQDKREALIRDLSYALSESTDLKKVIVITACDLLRLDDANHGKNAVGYEGIKQHMEALKDPVPAAAKDVELGNRGNRLLRTLLADAKGAEETLLKQLNQPTVVHAVFFTGIEGWGVPRAIPKPFGVAEAICWMARDAQAVTARRTPMNASRGAPGTLPRSSTRPRDPSGWRNVSGWLKDNLFSGE